jgi:large subunit ribosomal protein L2
VVEKVELPVVTQDQKGIPAKGFRTRSKTKESNKYIIERRNK